MKAKKTILAVLAGTALLGAAAGAQARDGWAQIHRDFYHRGDHRGHYDRGNHYGHYYRAPRAVYPAPVYYGPPRYYAPRYYAPAPVYYEPAPVVYGRVPLGNHSSIGFSIPLY
jgi:hypothetical protein